VPVRSLLLMIALVGVMAMPYNTLMPVVAKQVLHGGPHTLGMLMTAAGVGALAGTLYLASRRTILGLGRVILVASLALGLALVAFSFSRSLWLSLALLPFVGGGMMLQAAATNTILQTVVEERLRGRVMALYATAILGTLPIGSLLAGAMASRIGAPRTILIGGCACVAGAIWFAFRRPALARLMRPVYMERGILPWEESATQEVMPTTLPGIDLTPPR